MYKSIVSRKTKAVYRALNHGDPGPLIGGLDSTIEHVMYGEHALAGHRSTRQAVQLWYARLFRLLPDLEFQLDTILVNGPPWRTRVAVEWRDSALGRSYHNRGVNLIELRWGRVRAVRIHCDSQEMAAVLGLLAARGVTEASAAPILDDDRKAAER